MQTLERTLRSLGRNAINRYPSVRKPTLRGWDAYRLAYSHLVCYRDALRYARHTDLSPFETVSVDPDQIEYLVGESGYPSQTYESTEFSASKFKYAGTVRGGDWDSRETRFEETDLYQAFEAHFKQGVAWTDTLFFERVVNYVNDGVSMWGCTSEAEFKQRCQQLDDLYESIHDRGYLSRHELAQLNNTNPIDYERSSEISRRAYDEVTVCIGRDGDIMFFDGRNRLAIAKLLDLETIPVWIMIRHKKWQRFREAIAANRLSGRTLSDNLQQHPDFD